MFKTEVMNWDGSVFSTVKTTFNGRDQATLARQYSGSDTSPTYQDTTAAFDGHGRLKTQHLPEMDAGAYSISEYQADDSLLYKWDARGAKTTFGYDTRGLLTSLTSQAPAASSMQITPTVTFTYDAVGNHIQMQDGAGQVDYEYNQLSQLSAETRTFNSSMTDAPPSANGFRFSYAYHLGGSLKNVSYPNQISLNYGLDRAGKLKNISGTSEGQALSVLTNVDYLAWGGVKRVDFGNSTYSQVTYNRRQQPDTEKYTGQRRVAGGNNSFETATLIDNKYTYYNDGAIKLIEDKANILPYSYLDRFHQYDNTGKLVAERSGREALQTAQIGDFVKYAYNFSYDAFGNMKSEQAQKAYNSYGGAGQFNNIQTRNYTYQNNRIAGGYVSPVEIYGNIQLPAWQYDSDGRPVVSFDKGRLNSSYDTGGYLVRQQSGFGIAGGIVQDMWNSGDGKVIKTKDTDSKTTDENGDPANFTQTSTRYVLTSTVLGDAIVYQDNQDSRYPPSINTETKTSIYGLGNKIGVETKLEGVANVPNGIFKTTEFTYKSAYESKRLKSEYSTDASNGSTSTTTVSTRGLDANAITHTPSGRGNSDGRARFDEDFNEWLTGEGCSLDGIIGPCSYIIKAGGKYSGAYLRCPNDNCGPQGLAYHALDGSVTPFLGTLIATQDGIDYRLPAGIARAAIMDAMLLSIKNHGISGIAFAFNGGPINIGNVGTVTVNADYAPIDPTALASLSVDDACGLMANMLGQMISDGIASGGGTSAIKTHEQLDALMNALDSAFTPFYTGWNGTIKTGTGDIRPSTGGLEKPPPLGGPSGFKKQYLDSVKPAEGQTHHFAAYFSAGINGAWFSSTAHEYTTDRFNIGFIGSQNNQGDRDLGAVAYNFGTSLTNWTHAETRSNPRNPKAPTVVTVQDSVSGRLGRFTNLASSVRATICNY